MAITASNGLNGTDGVQPDATSIAATGDAPTFLDNTRLLYDDTHLVRGRVPIQFSTGYALDSTGRIRFDLPATGPWSARWYVWMPDLQDAGLGTAEVRWHVGFPDTSLGYVTHTTAAGNAGTRLQSDDLDASAIVWDTETGSAVAADQLWRIELTYDGTDLTSSIYAGDATTGARIHVWDNRDVGRSIELTAYRYRRGAFLPYGNGAFDQEVQDYQNFLIDLGYPAPLFGADGFYGDEMADQLDGFAGDFGFEDLVGTFGSGGHAGAEVLAGIDLAWQEDQAVATPPPLWIGNFAITDTGTAVGPLDEVDTSVAESVQFGGAVVAEDTTTTAHETFSLAGEVPADGTTKAVQVSEDESIEFSGDVTLTKAVDIPQVSDGVEFDGSVVVTTESLISDPPPLPPQMRLAIYDPGMPASEGLRGYFYHPESWSASFVLNDVGGMSLTYSRQAPGAHLLESIPFELAVELSEDGATYTEPNNARFISLRRTLDQLDRTQMATWTLSSAGWMLRKAKLIDNLTDGERTFTGHQPAAIMAILHSEAFDRDVYTAMTRTFTSTNDSDGQAWTNDLVDITYGAGTDLATIVDAFASEGYIDWRYREHRWEAFNRDTVLNQDISDDVVLRTRGVALEFNAEWRFDDYARRVQGRRENAAVTSVSGIVQHWGRWEDFITLPGDVTANQLLNAVSGRIDETENPQLQYTRRAPVIAGQPVPLLDYNPGDHVGVEDELTLQGAGLTTRRVRQISLEYGSDRIMTVSEVFDQRFLDRNVKLGSILDRITNRSSKILGAGAWKSIQ